MNFQDTPLRKTLFSTLRSIFTILSFSLISGNTSAQRYELEDFFRYIPRVEAKVDSIYNSLTEEQKAGQLIMVAAGKYGKSDDFVDRMVIEGKVGGVLLLNGTKEDFTQRVDRYDSLTKVNGHLTLIYCADAEPSLIRYKIKGTSPVKNADEHRSASEVRETARTIAGDLNDIGITLDFAPVIDISTQNEAIGNRSFGSNSDSVVAWSRVFVDELQKQGVGATIKHFPGHGMVKGDTHKKLVFIDGEMTEVPNYKPFCDNSAIAVMVGHIAVQNNDKYGTNGLPSTVSRKIVTDLLRGELGFNGIVVTDAMNMGGVRDIEDRSILALKAGCDILLMPYDIDADIQAIKAEMERDPEFAKQAEVSIRRIIRYKVILGLL